MLQGKKLYYKVYCQSLGDFLFSNCPSSSSWQKESILNFTAYNTDVIPEAPHKNWIKHKIEKKWR